jgi:hypothetical protein
VCLLAPLTVCSCSAVDVPVAEWDPPTGRYLEAESGSLSSGFTVGTDVTASGGSYLAPPAGSFETEPGAARASYDLTITRAGDYVVWGRIRSPGASSNRFWFQVDGGAWHKWRISVGDIWYWDALHEDAMYGTKLSFSLTVGTHSLVLANCVEGAWLDRLYITADGDLPPGNDTPCSPPHSIQLAGVCQPSCGSHGDTTCGMTACAGKTALPAYDCDVCCIAP